ncbi:uncharacterized protein LOC131956986 [Physella acuta]|uniref:uncharacterized protein LOC131956986 n=1 Tax=Physella acuta TaxID=109671 RepID=UPI0027DB3C85|nr:uncharacterized protein LOC131956986 [Physella acuta]
MTTPFILALLLSPFVAVVLWLFTEWILRNINEKHVPKIYVQPGFFYPLKYKLFRIILWLRKRQNDNRLRRKQSAESAGAGYGIQSRNSPEEMDRLQQLSQNHPLAVDAVYFNGGNSDGVFLVAATARRHEGIVQTILYLQVPSIGLLELPNLPDTWLTSDSCESAYAAGGLIITPIKPMEEWSISFNGSLRIADTKQNVHVKFSLLWKAYTKPFDFDTDLHPHVMADGIAREKWSRDYFDTLKKAHQTHYEQFGEIQGTVQIAGHQDLDIKVQGVRDHSYGNIRDWKLFHRYVLNYVHLEDGTAICVGAISMPITLSRLVVGYVFHPDGSMDPVSGTDFEFYNWGDDGEPPTKLILNFTAGDKDYYMVSSRLHCPVFYMGKEWDAKIYERFCTYSVNGIKGWGISEWDYRNLAGKKLKG